MLWKIYEALKNDSFISEKVKNRINFYEYPEAKTLKKPYIVIDPLSPPKPSDYADDTWLTEDFLIQIDVWAKNQNDTESIAKQIQDILWKKFRFRFTGDGIDEYDKDLKIFRDARRYRGKMYRK